LPKAVAGNRREFPVPTGTAWIHQNMEGRIDRAPASQDPRGCEWRLTGVIDRIGGKGGLVRRERPRPDSDRRKVFIERCRRGWAEIRALLRNSCRAFDAEAVGA